MDGGGGGYEKSWEVLEESERGKMVDFIESNGLSLLLPTRHG